MWTISLFLKITTLLMGVFKGHNTNLDHHANLHSPLYTLHSPLFINSSTLPTTFSILHSPFSIPSLHPVHSSGCLIEWNEQDKSLEISLKIFSDDLDMAVSRQANKKLFLGTEYESTNADEYLLVYLNEHFKLSLNDRPVQWEFIGKEVKRKGDFEIWIYLQVTNVPEVHKLNVTQSILTEHYADQSNYVNAVVRGEKKGLVLGMAYPSGEIFY